MIYMVIFNVILSNDTHISYRPVVVKMSHLVCKTLHVIWFESSCVPDNIVVCWRNSSLANGLRDQEEVIPIHKNS